MDHFNKWSFLYYKNFLNKKLDKLKKSDNIADIYCEKIRNIKLDIMCISQGGRDYECKK